MRIVSLSLYVGLSVSLSLTLSMPVCMTIMYDTVCVGVRVCICLTKNCRGCCSLFGLSRTHWGGVCFQGICNRLRFIEIQPTTIIHLSFQRCAFFPRPLWKEMSQLPFRFWWYPTDKRINLLGAFRGFLQVIRWRHLVRVPIRNFLRSDKIDWLKFQRGEEK